MTQPLGSSPVSVSRLGFGAASLGNLYRAIDDDQADDTVVAAWRVGVRYFDTAPHYGLGLSEERLGAALRAYPRAEYTLSTKVGRLLVPGGEGSDLANGFDTPATHHRVWDFSADGVRRSLEASLTRLGLDHIDIVLMHDPDASDQPDRAVSEAYPALDELRRDKVIGAIGVGSKDVPTLLRFATETDVDALMIAGRYTLLEQPALDAVLPACSARGISVLNAGIFNSGLLATDWPDASRPYEYGAAPPEVVRRAQAIAACCRAHGVALPHAAIAFAGAHPAIASVVVGAGRPSHIEADGAWQAAPLPDGLWRDLRERGLLRADAPVPGPAVTS